MTDNIYGPILEPQPEPEMKISPRVDDVDAEKETLKIRSRARLESLNQNPGELSTYLRELKKINTQLNNAKKEQIDRERVKSEEAVQKLQLELENQPLPTPNSLRDNPETTDKFNILIENGYFQDVYNRTYYDDGRMKQSFIDFVSDSVSITPDKKSAETAKPLLIPMDMEIEIEGIGGIVPGNSYHSTYLPSRYQEEAMFQIFDVGHKVDSSGWSVSISGVMRSSFSKLTQSNKTVSISQVTDSLLKLINDKAAADKDLEEKKIQQQNIELRDKVKR